MLTLLDSLREAVPSIMAITPVTITIYRIISGHRCQILEHPTSWMTSVMPRRNACFVMVIPPQRSTSCVRMPSPPLFARAVGHLPLTCTSVAVTTMPQPVLPSAFADNELRRLRLRYYSRKPCCTLISAGDSRGANITLFGCHHASRSKRSTEQRWQVESSPRKWINRQQMVSVDIPSLLFFHPATATAYRAKPASEAIEVVDDIVAKLAWRSASKVRGKAVGMRAFWSRPWYPGLNLHNCASHVAPGNPHSSFWSPALLLYRRRLHFKR